ncbi:hypothetical protein KUDE01_012680, partial [Dissostichus eleginoides]
SKSFIGHAPGHMQSAAVPPPHDLRALLESGVMEQESTSGPVRVYVHFLQFKVERQAAISILSMEEVFVCWSLLVSLRERVVEVLNGMRDLKIEPDSETLSYYVFPAFANIEEARQSLKDAGISLESEGFFASKIRSLAVYNLAELHTMLADPSFPAMELSVFRGSLIVGFKKSSDVESMVKITELLFKDQRFSKEGTKTSDTSSFFLYNFIDNMSEGEVHANEDKLRKYFNQLKDQKISVTPSIYRGLRNLLEAYQAPELIKRAEGRVSALEKKLAQRKAENQPLANVLKQTIQSLVAEENLVRALELKQEYEDEMVIPAYASLIGLCCRHNNVEEALNLKREMTRKDSSVMLDGAKYIALVQSLAKNDRLEARLPGSHWGHGGPLGSGPPEGDEREGDGVNDKHTTLFFHMLFSLATKGGAPTVQRLQDSMFTLGLAKPNSNLLSPLVTAYIGSEDLSGALEAVISCQKRFNHMPPIHRIIVGLVEKGDTDLLQKAMDFVSQERGEMAMLYELFFAFLQTGRYREARKIIETPGLRARAARMQWYAEKCINSNQSEPLEQMVDMTDKLFECDRDEMYSYLFRQYEATNEWKKAEALWTKMQEENVIPRERTLLMLSKILKNNGQEVPFDVPKPWYQEEAPTAEVKRAAPKVEEGTSSRGTSSRGTSFQGPIIVLCKKNKAQEALKMFKNANDNGSVFNAITYDHLIRTLLAEGSFKDAMAVKDIATSHLPKFQMSPAANDLHIITQSMKGQADDALERMRSLLQADQMPSQLAITRLVQALGNSGNVSGIQEVQELINGHSKEVDMSSMIFVNNTAMAHIKSGDVDSAMETLEAVYTSPDSQSQSMAFVFRKILEDKNEKALDKLSAMAERLANHFACYRPASDLFVQLLDAEKVEDAKFMLARINALAEQRDVLVSYMSQKSHTPGQLGKIKTLLSLIPDFAEKDVVNMYLMKCHITDKDFSSAKALYEEWQKSGGEIDKLSLKRLAVMYRESGETVPFEEPPESFKFYADKLREREAKSQKKAET